MEPNAAEIALKLVQEEYVANQILTLQHLGLVIGLYAVIGLLKKITPLAKFLFTEKWDWLIAPICLALASILVWAFDLSSFESNGMKLVAVVFLSMAVTWTHEAVIKQLLKLFSALFLKKVGANTNGDGQ